MKTRYTNRIIQGIRWVLIILMQPLLLFPAAGAAQEGLAATMVIKLDIPAPKDTAGGIIVADVDSDGKMDYLVSVPGHLAVYGSDGKKLWLKKADLVVGGSSEREGLPGHHGPGVAAGDVDGDGKCEVVFITKDSVIHIVDGATGKEQARARPPVPPGAERWEVAMICDLRGAGDDRDLLLQATNARGYRMGKYLAAYSHEALVGGGRALWTTDKFLCCAHNSARVADIDGDGRDEVLGGTIVSPKGKFLYRVPLTGHLDSVFVADVRPDISGLEIVALEEGDMRKKDRDRVFLYNSQRLIWQSHYRHQEPQNAAVGRFGTDGDDFFIWCRSRYNEHQKPFVFDATGKKVFDYAMDDVAPPGWTAGGVEVIHTINWTGRRQQLACAKERHKKGDVCLFEPLTGKFVMRIKEKTDRLYVVDVAGDWREEIIVLNGNELHIYQNHQPNPNPQKTRLWANRNYRRIKQCHNYYSP